MSNTNNSNRLVVPGAREAMDKFKMEAASEVGVNLKQGYNGDLTSRQAGSVGGQMVKNVCPVGAMSSSSICSGVLPSTRASCVSVSTLVGIRLSSRICSGRMS